ncbi:MAG: hypothetical protein HQL42_02785 [Alphaproteobacteria bacterium]|nr:hypothetical protein [Alphaproteobacteria bacterium]
MIAAFKRKAFRFIVLLLRTFSGKAYFCAALVMLPLNLAIALVMRFFCRRGTVAHIGGLYHLHYQYVEVLRSRGVPATFFAVGPERRWRIADHHLPDLQWLFLDLFRDMWFFWRYLARHEVIHSHCLIGLSHYQWEFLVLKVMGRRLVGHFRGCEGRERAAMRTAEGEAGICQECDYFPNYLCEFQENRRRRLVARHLCDALLVTTPDLLDLWPTARHLPFFLPVDAPAEISERPAWTPDCGRPLTIVHVTDQPGIEGSEEIRRCLARLRNAGLPIEFRHVTGASRDEVYAALAEADLSIGKMRMGYYANAQIEAMIMGVPTVTWVRDDLRSPELEDSGLIICTLPKLEETVRGLIENPDLLAAKKRIARDRVVQMHGVDSIVSGLYDAYGWTAHGR